MHIVETQEELILMCSHIGSDAFVMDAVCIDHEKHAQNNNISLLMFYFMSSKSLWCLPLHHNETLPIANSLIKVKDHLKFSIHNKFVFDKKSIIQLFDGDYDFIDLGILKYLDEGVVDQKQHETNAHTFIRSNFRDVPNTNACTPIYKHIRTFSEKINNLGKINNEMIRDDGFKFVNNTMTKCFAKLENVGLCVNENFTDEFGNDQTKHIKNNLVFSQYNLLTSTGRPSNRFGGVNYAALNKNDGSRECFISRHKSNGMLVMMDYNAFHPRLIAHLVNFNMSADENPYAYLAKYFFNKKEANDEDIAVAKGFTFTQLYGGIDKKWLHIPYFSKIQEYIDHRWKFFEQNGYIETPKYKRKIKECHIPDANPSKLFNYILQAFETETAVEVLGDILSELNGKKTQPILYTYDSILFDAHKADKMDTIKKLKNIMERGKFPVKIYVGNNYKEMKQISMS